MGIFSTVPPTHQVSLNVTLKTVALDDKLSIQHLQKVLDAARVGVQAELVIGMIQSELLDLEGNKCACDNVVHLIVRSQQGGMTCFELEKSKGSSDSRAYFLDMAV